MSYDVAMQKKFCVLVALVLLSPLSRAAPLMWEAGRLDYPDGSAEVAAFVNTDGDSQLQLVLCTKNEPQDYRISLLLPKSYNFGHIFEVRLEFDGQSAPAYAELSGNSLEFALGSSVLMAWLQSPNLTLIFKEEDAQLLELPSRLEVPMTGGSLAMSKVASECTALCLNNNFNCRKSLLSGMLWPQRGFNADGFFEVDRLCTKSNGHGGYSFDLNDGCKSALDRFYVREGPGPLSFWRELMANEQGSYQNYVRKWNRAVSLMANAPVGPQAYADDSEWYLSLYSLAGTRQLSDFPHSYYEIKNHGEDPTTLVYDIENRYDLEALKYTAVLMRRNSTSLAAQTALDEALRDWVDFYRELSYLQPPIRSALALRPIIYRTMLLRIWRMAGMPQGLTITPEFAFVQGTGGKTVTNEELEKKCSYFEGLRRDQFFMPTADCLRSIETGIRHQGFKNSYFDAMVEKWEDFYLSWVQSPFYDGALEEVNETSMHTGLALTLLSLYRIYGFGDYFLLRSCISTRDGDICSFESLKAERTLQHEFHNKLASVMAVSPSDGQLLNSLQQKWLSYQDALSDFLEHEVTHRTLPLWRAELVKAVSAIVQTDVIINAPYKEEMPDLTVDGAEDDFEDQSFERTEIVSTSKEPSPQSREQQR